MSRRRQQVPGAGNEGFPWLGPEEYFEFPDPLRGAGDEPLALGGNLAPGLLLSAYQQGIFPWYSEGPIQWWCPDPRFVIPLAELHVPRSLLRTLRRRIYTVTFDTAFDRVIAACAAAFRPGQGGTWIVPEMQAAYGELHRLGYAHSVETWLDGRLVGGLYGVAVGRTFCGESMFSQADDASKVAFWQLSRLVAAKGLDLIDSQVHTELFARFGARHISRADYLATIRPRTVERQGPLFGSWSGLTPAVPD